MTDWECRCQNCRKKQMGTVRVVLLIVGSLAILTAGAFCIRVAHRNMAKAGEVSR